MLSLGCRNRNRATETVASEGLEQNHNRAGETVRERGLGQRMLAFAQSRGDFGFRFGRRRCRVAVPQTRPPVALRAT
jgi:hypothetical protein